MPSLPNKPPSARFRRDTRAPRERLNDAIQRAESVLGFASDALSSTPNSHFAEDISGQLASERLAPPALTAAPPSSSPRAAREHTERAPALSGGQRIAREIAERSWKRERRAEREKRRDREFFERRKAELEAEHRAAFDAGAIIPAHVWRTCWQIVDDRSGRAAWHALRQLPTAYRGALSRAFADRDWANPRARRLCALTFGLYSLRRRAQRPSRWGFRVDAVPIEALCVLLREPSTGHTPGRTALSGTHRPNANLGNGQFGYLKALRAVGVVYRLQRRQCADNPSCNQYWLLDPHSGYTNMEQRAFSLDLARDAVFLKAPAGARAPPMPENRLQRELN